MQWRLFLLHARQIGAYAFCNCSYLFTAGTAGTERKNQPKLKLPRTGAATSAFINITPAAETTLSPVFR